MRKPNCRKTEKNKGTWSKEEDQKLVDYVAVHGEGSWTSAQPAGLNRCSRSCQLRWINHLSPEAKCRDFGEDEEDLIIRLHALLGNRWSLIAGRLPGRTENEVKDYWDCYLKKKLINMGIDPDNHRISQTTKQAPSYIAKSSGSQTWQPSDEPKAGDDNNDEVSDAGSSSFGEDSHVSTTSLSSSSIT